MTVVVSLPDQENEYQVLQAKDARSTAARLGLDIELLDAEGSPVRQIQQILKRLRVEPKPRALVIEPLSTEAVVSITRKTMQAGIGTAVLNCTVPNLEALRAERPGIPVFTVGSDQIEIGRVQGRQIRALLPAGGNVLYIHGPQGATAAKERMEGFTQATQDAGLSLTILDAQWSEESAEQAVAQWLRLKTSEGIALGAVAAQDDSMARGARRAIAAMPEVAPRWSNIPFLGIDGLPELGQKLVREGELTATVVMPSNTGPALELVARWLNSGVIPLVTVHLPVRSFPDERQLRHRRVPSQASRRTAGTDY